MHNIGKLIQIDTMTLCITQKYNFLKWIHRRKIPKQKRHTQGEGTYRGKALTRERHSQRKGTYRGKALQSKKVHGGKRFREDKNSHWRKRIYREKWLDRGNLLERGHELGRGK